MSQNDSNSPDLKARRSGNAGRWIGFSLAMLALIALFAVAVKGLIIKEETVIEGYQPWDKEVVAAAAAIPVQSDGRLKPLETYASFFMLGLRGDRGIKIKTEEDGKDLRVKPTAWLLDIFFRPEIAREFPTFRVDDSGVLESLGLKPNKRRDRFSYNELSTVRDKINELGKEYEEVQKRGLELDTGQTEILVLARNLVSYEGHLLYFQFTKVSEQTGNPEMRWSSIVNSAERYRSDLSKFEGASQIPGHLKALQGLIERDSQLSQLGPAFFPANAGKGETLKNWHTVGRHIYETFTVPGRDSDQASHDFALLENIADVSVLGVGAEESAQQVKAWTALKSSVTNRMPEVNQKEISHELSYNKRKWFFSALFIFFIPAVLFTVLSFLFQPEKTKAPFCGFFALFTPRGIRYLAKKTKTILIWLSGLLTVFGLIYLIAGITQRCLITHRPPVGNLFETIPFITACSVGVLLLVELFNRRRLALSLAPIIGFLGLVLARRYELGDDADPLNPLRAVLVSNFWLTYHVLSITFGYAAGIVAGLISHAYIFLRLFKLDDPEGQNRKTLTRMSYGMICFTLLLSLIGTILGGIWANDSWGRFWGWDPKENGALMIVIWCLFILHARVGGIIKEWGLHLCAVFTTVIVTFSWWGVNMLGEGLHSYGFTEGSEIVNLFYSIEIGIIIIGACMAIHEKGKKKQAKLRKA